MAVNTDNLRRFEDKGEHPSQIIARMLATPQVNVVLACVTSDKGELIQLLAMSGMPSQSNLKEIAARLSSDPTMGMAELVFGIDYDIVPVNEKSFGEVPKPLKPTIH